MTELEKDIETFKKNNIEKNKEFVFKFLDQNYSLEDVQKFISELKDSHNNNDIIYDQETENILSIIIEIKRIEKAFNEIGCHHENDNERWDNVIKNSIWIIKNSISKLSDTNKEKIKKYINKLILEMDDYTYQSDLIDELFNNYILDLLDDNTLEQILESTRIELSEPCYKQQLEGFERSINAISRLKRLSATQEIDINSFLQIKELISELTIEKNNTAVESFNGYIANILLQKFNNRTPMMIKELKELNEYCEKGIVDIEEDDKKRLDDLLNKKEQAKAATLSDDHLNESLEAYDCLNKIFSKIKMFSIKEIDVNSLSQIKEQISKLAAIGGYETIVEFANEYVAQELLHKFSHRTPMAIEELKELNEYCEKGIVDIEEVDKKRLGDLLNEKEQAQEENIVRGKVSKLKSFFKAGIRTIEQTRNQKQNIVVNHDMDWLDYRMEENEKSNKHR